MKLEGIRVLDLSRFLPGPHLAMMMADHGADVIKIEDTKSGDPARVIGPAEGGHTVYFRNANRESGASRSISRARPGARPSCASPRPPT